MTIPDDKLPDVWVGAASLSLCDALTGGRGPIMTHMYEADHSIRYVPASRLDAMREALRAAGIALSDLGACDDPECPDPICVRALTKVRAALKDSA